MLPNETSIGTTTSGLIRGCLAPYKLISFSSFIRGQIPLIFFEYFALANIKSIWPIAPNVVFILLAIGNNDNDKFFRIFSISIDSSALIPLILLLSSNIEEGSI